MSGSGRTRSSEEVADALRDGAAVVALESTLITHGLPWPVNLETARGSEQAVRAAGAVPATLERLETLGVAVIGFQTSEFPAFTTRSSGLALDASVDSPEEAAYVLKAHLELDSPGTIVLAQPVAEEVALDRAMMEGLVQTALEEAKEMGVIGKQVTPFLLDRIRIATGGESLKANQRLIIDNARLAARVARAFASIT